MAVFSYHAMSMSGESITGEYQAPDEAGVIAMIRQSGYYQVSVKKIGEESRPRYRKIPLKHLATLCTQMAAMLKAGVPIAHVMDILKGQTDHKKLAEILGKVYDDVLRGQSLSESFAIYTGAFPALFLNMIEAGEASGTLDMCMERAGVAFARIAKLNGKVKNAMIYPCVILVVLIGLLLGMFLVVLPAFAELYEGSGAELPAFTQALLDAGEFVQHSWYVVLGAVAVVVIGLKIWLASDKGGTTFDRWKFGFPVINKMLRKIYAARFARTLSSLNASGVPLTQALDVTARSVLNRHFEKELYKAVAAINSGSLLSDQLGNMKLLPPMIVYMTRIGEESGAMDDLLLQAADFYDDESDTAIQGLTTIVEPVLIVLMALIIGPVLLGVLMPLFGMHEAMLL